MRQRPAPATGDGDSVPEVLLRLPVDGTDWSEHVPPSPRGHDVSVSFASAGARGRHAEALRALGYRIVDADDHPSPGEYADVVLRSGTAEATPSWWRAMAALAERAYPLSLGPAALVWTDLIDRHERQAP